MSTGTRRQDHDRADAYAHVRAMVNLEMGRYARRLKAAAEARVDELYQQAAVTGEPFDYLVAAEAGIRHARSMYVAAELEAGEPAVEDA